MMLGQLGQMAKLATSAAPAAVLPAIEASWTGIMSAAYAAWKAWKVSCARHQTGDGHHPPQSCSSATPRLRVRCECVFWLKSAD